MTVEDKIRIKVLEDVLEQFEGVHPEYHYGIVKEEIQLIKEGY